MGSINLRNEQRQTQALSPSFQHAVRLLQMSSLDFAAAVRDVMGKNPFLEPVESEPEIEGDDGETTMDSSFDAAPEAAAADDGEAEPLQPADTEQQVPTEPGIEDDRDLWHADGGSGNRPAEDGELSAMELMAAETSLTAHLSEQLNVLPLSARDLLLAHTIVESLDDDGYLRTPLEELAEVAGLEPLASLPEMQIALKRVQSLDPAGVGARDVGECMLLQLHTIDCPKMRGLAQAIVTGHIQALASRDTAALARDLKENPVYVQEVCDRLRRLDPRPGWRFSSSSDIAYVVPDVLVKKVRNQWIVQLNPAVVPRVKLNQVYADLFQRHRNSGNGEMASHLQEARWTLRNVEQRFSTILDVARCIVARQKHFLDFGPMAMKPMGLREIADELGIHESTVSRVTNNKYMSTPTGVFELKHFFSRAMVSANGSACSGTAIRGLISDMIEAEKPDMPLSDAEITRQLSLQGLVVARRTVTKYRQMLKIESVDRRRRVVE